MLEQHLNWLEANSFNDDDDEEMKKAAKEKKISYVTCDNCGKEILSTSWKAHSCVVAKSNSKREFYCSDCKGLFYCVYIILIAIRIIP